VSARSVRIAWFIFTGLANVFMVATNDTLADPALCCLVITLLLEELLLAE
jgi:hypothetical protein